MQNKLIQIFNFFDGRNGKTQFDKLEEEYKEFNKAYTDFEIDRSKENFENLILEVSDVAILLLQIGIVKFGYNFHELIAMGKEKLNRTVWIMKEMILNPGKTYEEIKSEYY